MSRLRTALRPLPPVFVLASFPEQNGRIAVIPRMWLTGTDMEEGSLCDCKWPQKDISTAVQNSQKPEANWGNVRVEILRFCKNYTKAMKVLKKYQMDNDVKIYPINEEPLRNGNTLRLVPVQGTSSFNLAPLNEIAVAGHSCSCCLRNQALIEGLIHSVEDLKEEVRTTRTEILEQFQIANNVPLITDITKATTFEEMYALENKLKDIDEFNKTVAACSSLGGKDAAETVRRILSQMIEHSVSLRLNWAGSENKKSIQCYPQILQCVFVAVRTIPEFSMTSQAAVEDHVKRWLRNAADRNGGRNRRTRKIKLKYAREV